MANGLARSTEWREGGGGGCHDQKVTTTSIMAPNTAIVTFPFKVLLTDDAWLDHLIEVLGPEGWHRASQLEEGGVPPTVMEGGGGIMDHLLRLHLIGHVTLFGHNLI